MQLFMGGLNPISPPNAPMCTQLRKYTGVCGLHV